MKLPDPVAIVARKQFGVIRNDQLAALGLSRAAISRRVEWGLLEPTLPGVYRLAGGDRTWRQELMAACLWGNDRPPAEWPGGVTAAISHEAAAGLHGFDGFAEGPVVLTTPRQARSRRTALTVHRATPEGRFILMIDGIPVTNVPRTLVDLGVDLEQDALERVIDDALRQGLTKLKWLRWTAERVAPKTHGRPGARKVLAILDARRPLDGPSASAFQKDVRTLLLSGGLRIHEEHVVLDPDQKFIARVDFELEFSVVVEAQSRKYHSSWAAQMRDWRRHNKVTGRGKFVIYVTPQDLRDRPQEVLAEIRETVAMARALREVSSI